MFGGPYLLFLDFSFLSLFHWEDPFPFFFSLLLLSLLYKTKLILSTLFYLFLMFFVYFLFVYNYLNYFIIFRLLIHNFSHVFRLFCIKAYLHKLHPAQIAIRTCAARHTTAKKLRSESAAALSVLILLSLSCVPACKINNWPGWRHRQSGCRPALLYSEVQSP